MGFDIKAFIAKVEQEFSKIDVKGQGKIDGVLNSYEKASIFNNAELKSELNNAIANGDISAESAKELFGLELSGSAQSAAPSRAGANNTNVTLDDGTVIITNPDGSITLDFSSSNSWYININVDADMQKYINQLIEAFNQQQELNIDKLIEYIDNKSNSVSEFLLGIIQSLKGDIDLANIENLLGAISEKLNELGIKVEGLSEQLNQYLTKQMQVLKKMGMDIESLVALVQEQSKTQEEQNEKLGLIYDAIIKLTDTFDDATEAQQEQLNTIIAMIGQNGVTLEKIMELLEVIKADTSENNETSKKLVKLISEGKTEILDALAKIETVFEKYGDDIKAKMLNILEAISNIKFETGNAEGNIEVNVDIDAILSRLDEMLGKLDKIDGNTADCSKKLDTVLEFLSKLDKDFGQYKADILVALGNVKGDIVAAIEAIDITIEGGTEVNLTELLNKLDEIKESVDGNKTEISNQIANILTLLGTINTNSDNSTKIMQDILVYIQNLPQTDLTEVLDLLQKIYDRLDDIKIEITENGCHCCKSDPSKPNEGENDDLDDLIMRANVFFGATIGEEDTSSIKTVDSDSNRTNAPRKYIDENGHVVIEKNGRKYRLDGK